MAYLAIAVFVALWVAVDLEDQQPLDLRETIGSVLLCAVIGAAWPLVLLWRLLLGPEPAS